jgi:hypothetical protein
MPADPLPFAATDHVKPALAPNRNALDRLSSAMRGVVQRRTPILEPLALIAAVSLVTAWAVRPFAANALAGQGPVAQGAVQAVLWLSAILSPFAALVKAATAATACWAIAIYLDEQMPLAKLVSLFCLAELIFSIRDLAMCAVLALRGTAGVRSAADLVVPFGLNAFLHADSTLTRLAFESWDFFHVAWALLVFFMVYAVFETRVRSAACLAIAALVFRLLFSAAGLLYGG